MKKIIYILIVFILLNIFLQFLFFIKDQFIDQNQIFRKYGKEKVLKAYPDVEEEQVDALLQNTWDRPVVYDEATYFKEQEYDSEYVHIHPKGIRYHGKELTWPINVDKENIFVFGGSTTFGYGQKGEHTIPAFLQQYVKQKNSSVEVYNFGAAFYYSTQEKLKLASLVEQGVIPDRVIFIDGLNEFYMHDSTLVERQNELKDTWKNNCIYWAKNIPIGRLVYSLYKLTLTPEEQIYAPDFADYCVERYFTNKSSIEAICKKHAIPVLFVIQPVPYYHYDLTHHLFISPEMMNEEVRKGYTLWSKEKLDTIQNLLWLADMQKNKNYYVDEVHYTKEMNRMIAKEIVENGLKNDY